MGTRQLLQVPLLGLVGHAGEVGVHDLADDGVRALIPKGEDRRARSDAAPALRPDPTLEQRRPQRQLVPGFQLPLLNGLPVDVAAVCRLEIGDLERLTEVLDRSVPPGHALVGESDVALGRAPDRLAHAVRDAEDATGVLTLADDKLEIERDHDFAHRGVSSRRPKWIS